MEVLFLSRPFLQAQVMVQCIMGADRAENCRENPQLVKLIERAQRGDVRAFEELIKEYSPQVRRFARGFTSIDADDVAQEALVKAYLSLASYRFDSSFRTWLFRITRNACIDASRKRNAQTRKQNALREETQGAALHPGGEAHANHPEGSMLNRERQERLWHLIRQLPKRFRSPLILCDIEGMSYQEAAKIERIPVGTVRSRLARARKKLGELLSENAPEGFAKA